MGKKITLYSLLGSLILHLFFLGFSPRIRVSGLEGLSKTLERQFKLRISSAPHAFPREELLPPTPWREGVSWAPSELKEIKEIKLPSPKTSIAELLPPSGKDFSQEVISLSSSLLRYKIKLRPKRRIKKETGQTPFTDAGFYLPPPKGGKSPLPKERKKMVGVPSITFPTLPLPAPTITTPTTPLETKRKRGYTFWDELLKVKVNLYPEGGEKFFQVEVNLKKEAEVKPLSREIIFLLDASKSISPDKWEIFKKALRICLSHLRRDDVFNVVVFRERTFLWKKTSQPFTSQNMRDALYFVEKFFPEGETDIYQALRPWITRKGERFREIFLFTDGKPTSGFVRTRDFLLALSSAPSNVAIFGLGVGEEVKIWFLDLITRFGRGALFHRGYGASFLKSLPEFLEKYSFPVLTDVKIRFQGAEETYPLFPPSLYKNAGIVLTGRLIGEELLFRLTGRTEEGKKEMVFRIPVKDIPPGDKLIAYEWKMNHIYELIREAVIEEKGLQKVEKLMKLYSLPLPYLELIGGEK
ncbi:MAG TPA: VWA domain-containing protein [bacterium]|nr:VWA domain-containing protein [bacterium]HEX67729.1 VWA domain-containing protein [bacterium]